MAASFFQESFFLQQIPSCHVINRIYRRDINTTRTLDMTYVVSFLLRNDRKVARKIFH